MSTNYPSSPRPAQSLRPPRRNFSPRRLRLPAAAVALVVAAGPISLSLGWPGSIALGASLREHAAGARDSAINLSNVTLDIGDQAGAGSKALLQAAGLLSTLPFKADWADFPSGPPMLQAEAAGSVDIGAVGDAPPVFAASGGAKIAAVEALAAPVTAAALVVPKGSSVTSVAQLKGKTIAVAQGSSADYNLLVALTKAGLTVHDVTLDYLEPAEALAALGSGKVDAWDIWTPYIEEAVADDGARILANGSVTGTTYSFEVASRGALANPAKKAAIRAYLATLNKAYAWEKGHTEKWAATWGQATGLPLSVMEKATVDDVSKPLPITPSVTAAEQAVANAFYGAGLIPNKVNFGDYTYTGFNSSLFNN